MASASPRRGKNNSSSRSQKHGKSSRSFKKSEGDEKKFGGDRKFKSSGGNKSAKPRGRDWDDAGGKDKFSKERKHKSSDGYKSSKSGSREWDNSDKKNKFSKERKSKSSGGYKSPGRGSGEWDGKEKKEKFSRERKEWNEKPSGFSKKGGNRKWSEKSTGDSFDKRSGDRKSFGNKKWNDSNKPYEKKKAYGGDEGSDRKFNRDFSKKFVRKKEDETEGEGFYSFEENARKKKTFDRKKSEYGKLIRKSEKNVGNKEKENDGTIRLNKYISNAGICSRRDADKLIESGAVMVNGVVVTQLGTRIKPTDKIQYGGQTIKAEKMVYIVLNKPKDYITTMDDPEGRKTVMSLLRGACKERVYPVGRLDRNTTGVLLFTNDGELTRRLTHPKFLVSKMYHVTLDTNFAREDLEKMRNGIELEDGFIQPDQLEYTGETKKELGIEIHSGRNRIVRRMFEHLGYEVVKLDRVQFAGLTKKDVPRGKYRFLSEKEVGFLKML